MAKTTKEGRTEAHVGELNNDEVDDRDSMATQNNASMKNTRDDDNFLAFGYGDPESHSNAPLDSSVARIKKAKKSDSSYIRDILDIMATSHIEMTTVVREGNAYLEIIAKAMSERLPIPEEQVDDMLIDLGLLAQYLMPVYSFLIKHPDDLKAVLGSPLKKIRKEVVMELVFRGNAYVLFNGCWVCG